MARADILKQIMAKKMSAEEFSWNNIIPPGPLLRFLSMADIAELNKIATSVRLSSKPKLKYQYIDNILVPKGFKKMASGTNRVVYKYLEDQSFVIKVAYDKVGMSDNPNEYKNQFKLMPFCTKMFDISPCGTVALVERVEPITSREEFIAIAPSVFDMITTKLIGRYVLDDIGTKFFQNYGIRMGMGPVLLDYPYVYDIDGAKLSCNLIDPKTGKMCNGVIDYDDGFNMLICEKCRKQYFPEQLKKEVEGGNIIISKGETHKMKISIKRGKETVETYESMSEVESVPIPKTTGKIVIKGVEGFKSRHDDSVIDMDKPFGKSKGSENTTHKRDKRDDKKNENISSKNYGGNIDYEVFAGAGKSNQKSDIKSNDKKDKNLDLDKDNRSKFIREPEEVPESVYTTQDTDTDVNPFAAAIARAGISFGGSEESKDTETVNDVEVVGEEEDKVISVEETYSETNDEESPEDNEESPAEEASSIDEEYEREQEENYEKGQEGEEEWLLKLDNGDEPLDDTTYVVDELREEQEEQEDD